ncbi:MAG: cyclic nucleotide-binding domain-containing protein, partial [Proteobacteria bacterium]
LFAYLAEEERLLLLSEMQTHFFEDGKALVKQGEVGDEFFVLVKGAANATFRDPKGNFYFLADLGVGDAFGEIALIDDVPRTASIISDGGCIALGLKKEGFERFAQSLGSPDRVKTMIRLTSFFRRHPLFSKLGAKDQAELIDSVTFETITAGDEITEGDERFRVIYSGKVRMDSGDDAADTELNPDDCFGYASSLRAKYFATEGTGILSVNKDDFHTLVWEKLVERPELFV